MAYTRERLGQLLVKSGLIDDAQLAVALEYQARHGGRLGAILVEQLIVNEEQLATTLAEQKGLRHVSLSSYPIDRNVVSLIPERLARRKTMIPIGRENGRVVLAMADPLDVEAIDDVELRAGTKVEAVAATESQIRYAIEKYLSAQDAFQLVVDTTSKEEAATDDESGIEVPIVRLVNQLIREAVADRASDIHIEPMEKDVVVRFRVDGVMHETMRLPRNTRSEVASRVKIMAEMDISEKRRPQDGRIQVSFDGRAIDLRVATMPTPHGESIVIRLMNQGLTFHDLEDLGLSDAHLATLKGMLTSPHGAVLIAGPTGSGKSTTLYAAVKALNIPERKIITIEEPIEYEMTGVTQMAVNNPIGLTFAAGLRQMLRCDPDVVMVGEVRDPETAETAVRAALTGHLVLSSIHTNDAPSALNRLVDMGVAPFIISSALMGVIAQRLVRQLCPSCRLLTKPTKQQLVTAGFAPERLSKLKIYGPGGCSECFDTGYRGRVGAFEVMPVNDDIRRLFLEGASSDALRDLAVVQGMRTMRQDALDKVAAGITSLEEIARVVI